MKRSKPKYWIPILIIALIDVLLVGAIFYTHKQNQKEPVKHEFSEASIQRMCELATLECYYHNVSNWSQPGYGILGYGEKKVWIEYDGMVRVGINAGKISISQPDENDVITVTIPAATILEKDLDESSIREIASDKTVLLFFTDRVNTEDRKKALAAAQTDMEETASKNEMILTEAQERAKMIIERNIVSLGEAGGKQYKVKFINAAESPQSTFITTTP